MKKMNGFFPFLLLITSSAYAVVPPNLSGTIQGVVQPLAYSNTTHILSMPAATGSQNGYLTSTDWTLFNSKSPAITPGNISTSTTGLTVGSGTASTVGPNVTVDVQTASTSQPGLISSTDWNTFNNKQAAGSYITALTGDGTASGPGSSSFTLATVNSNVGSFTNAAITVNGKGLITAASSGTTGDLTDVGTDGITITGGVGAVIGSGTAIVQHVADSSHNGYLALADFNRFSTDQLNGELEVAYNRTYTLALAIPYSGVINTLKIQTTSGTCTAAVNINGTPVTGISAVSVTSSIATATATAANTFAANDKITLVITSASLANDLVYTLKVTKQ